MPETPESPPSQTPSSKPLPKSGLWARFKAALLRFFMAGSARTPEPQQAQAHNRPVPTPSTANTPQEYRKDAARHLYALNAERIFKGKLPPMLPAIGVLELELDRHGRIHHLNWMRAPSHAPEVMEEIERTVRLAAPFPAPSRLGQVSYTDTWLWEASGQFQLDTLTEGQL